MTEHQAEIDFQEQMETATDAICAAALELLQVGRVHPHVLLLTLARVADERGAGTALAGGMPVEAVLGDLVEVVRNAGQDHGGADSGRAVGDGQCLSMVRADSAARFDQTRTQLPRPRHP